MFENWQRVKVEVRDSETDRLKEKIQLQHELIKLQQQRAEQRQSQRHDRAIQKREKDKAEREARNNALQQICRDSLEDDRRVAKEKKASDQRQQLHNQNEHHAFSVEMLGLPPAPADNEVPPPDPEPTTDDPPLNETETSPTQATTGGVTLEGFEPVLEEEEEEDVAIEEEELPWHHAQLYQLYGKDADYFLHPKITTEKKADIVLNPRLRTIGGRAGAGVLWDVLRKESRMKLVRQDSKLLSPELKSAFGAFAREGLANNKKPLVRNFNSSDDVPDMEKLMDQSRIHNAQDFRHKVELMFRSSTINQNRTKVLLYNNPPPDINNIEGAEGVQRYLPSWLDDKWDEESELSYKKWLKKHEDETSQADVHDSATPRQSTNGGSTSRTQRTPREKTRREDTKYVFLTEEQARTPGQFTQRHRELEEARGRPNQHQGTQDSNPDPRDSRIIKSQSAMASVGGPPQSNVSSGSLTHRTGMRPRPHSEMSSQFISQWQPLSLNALMEYKQSQDALGQGEFSHGKQAVWSASKASVPAT